MPYKGIEKQLLGIEPTRDTPRGPFRTKPKKKAEYMIQQGPLAGPEYQSYSIVRNKEYTPPTNQIIINF